MPHRGLLKECASQLENIDSWDVNGEHYHLTAKAWLNNHQKNKDKITTLFKKHYQDESKALLLYEYWRIFYIACMALFSYKKGKEWYVHHVLFKKVK